MLSLTTALTGKLNVTGSLSSKATGAVGDAIGSLLGGNAAKQIGSINIKALNANAEIKGNITITSRPKLAASLAPRAEFGRPGHARRHQPDGGRRRVNVPAQVKPLIDKTVADQLAAVGDANPQRYRVGAQRAGAMGQGLPLDSAAGRRRRFVVAGAVAGAASRPARSRRSRVSTPPR